jgi:aryl-alcohol dehydrogenase-like predicted oxidoreductase
MSSQQTDKPVPRRPYGPHKIPLSIIGFGGILVMNARQDHANRLVAESVEAGVNYFDVAPTYGDAEHKLGPALKPFRKDVFLACKTNIREKEGAVAEFEQSLERLYTDYFDLYQLHALTEVDKDVVAVFRKNGLMDFLIDAKEKGRVRHLGFSAHSEAAALAALDRYPFDSVLFPINYVTWYRGDFGPEVVQKCRDTGTTLLALKSLARQHWPEDDPNKSVYSKCWYQPIDEPEEAEKALRFTLSQPVTAAIPPGEEKIFRIALDLSTQFHPITEEETEALKKKAQGLRPIFETPSKDESIEQ